LAVLGSAFSYVVREGQASVRTRLGQPVAGGAEAGLHFRWPWPVDRVVLLDARTQVLDTRHTEMLTRDKRNVVLLSTVRWRIADPLVFFQSVGSLGSANAKLDGLVTNAKIGVLGRYDLSALVSTDPDDLKAAEIEADLLGLVAGPAREKYGIEVQEVAPKRLSLPENNIGHVFDQMRAEREQYAARYRAEGEREASSIRAATDRQAAEIRSVAAEEVARIRGESEAKAADIYGAAHASDPELYRFVRSLQSVESLVGDQTTLILRTDSAPFSVLEEGAP
jgi:membrane protease subunit HflC